LEIDGRGARYEQKVVADAGLVELLIVQVLESRRRRVYREHSEDAVLILDLWSARADLDILSREEVSSNEGGCREGFERVCVHSRGAGDGGGVRRGSEILPLIAGYVGLVGGNPWALEGGISAPPLLT